MTDIELETFKTEINLTEYAAFQGYSLIRRESSRNSASMKHGDGDKIIVARGENNHWVYFSVRDDRDNGSIIDFVQKRQGVTLGRVRQILRPWISGSVPRPSVDTYMPEIQRSAKDRQSVIASYSRMWNTEDHPYLKSRAIGKEVLMNERFYGRIKTDPRGNAVFPHYDENGLSGYEIKNKGFTGFAPGGEKGLWVSNTFSKDNRLVITESAIDALSFHAIHQWENTRYVSTAGGWSSKTPSLLCHAVETLSGNEIVLAFDNDLQGQKYEDKVRELLDVFGKEIGTFFPVSKGMDWNDQLRKPCPPIS